MSDFGKIYLISNSINNKVYIGKTIQSLKNRWVDHISPWSNCRKLKEAMFSLGIEHFKIECLKDNIPYSELDHWEVYYINKYNSVQNGYNIKIGNTKAKGRNFHKIHEGIKESIIKDYTEGIKVLVISNKYKIGLTSIYNILKDNNIPKFYNKGGFNKNKSKIDLDIFIQLKALNYGTSELSLYFNVNKSSIKRYYKRHKDIILPRVSDILASKVEDENVL